jgi:hypothetical protein
MEKIFRLSSSQLLAVNVQVICGGRQSYVFSKLLLSASFILESFESVGTQEEGRFICYTVACFAQY